MFIVQYVINRYMIDETVRFGVDQIQHRPTPMNETGSSFSVANCDENFAREAVARLTAKQREVLDLLMDHKTSKEIALELNISPHTVDQRIQFAKRQLGVSSRADLARIYRQSKDMSDQTTYENSPISLIANFPQQLSQDEASALDPVWSELKAGPEGKTASRIVPELFVGAKGKVFRLVAIMMVALLTILLALGGVAIYSSLAELLSR
jgi:DNA-binding CsgD family transcriptional regulator